MKKNDMILHAYKGTEPYIFISYAHQDAEKVLVVIEWLNANGYRVWYDEGIETSNDFKDEISLNILNCSCFMVFLSNYSISRKFVRKEISFAEEQDKKVLPIYLEKNVKLPPGIKLMIGDIQGIELYKHKWDNFFEYLKQSLSDDLKSLSKDVTDKYLGNRKPGTQAKLKKVKKRFLDNIPIIVDDILRVLFFIILSIVIYFIINKTGIIGVISGN